MASLLLLLELLAECVVLVRRDDHVNGREEHRVFARLVRSVHAAERDQAGGFGGWRLA